MQQRLYYLKRFVRERSDVYLPELRDRKRGIYVHEAGHDEDEDADSVLSQSQSDIEVRTNKTRSCIKTEQKVTVETRSVGRRLQVHVISPKTKHRDILSIMQIIPCINSRWTPPHDSRKVKHEKKKVIQYAAIAGVTIDHRSRHRTSCCLRCTHLDLGAHIAPAQ